MTAYERCCVIHLATEILALFSRHDNIVHAIGTVSEEI
jgi:hypothetical protein